MIEKNSREEETARRAVVTLPYALYDSNGLLFELYDGGTPRLAREIRWVRISPIQETTDSSASRSKPSQL